MRKKLLFLVVSSVCEVNRVWAVSVFLCWLAYLAPMYMKSQFSQAWLAYSSREIIQITGGKDPLRGSNLETVKRNYT